jgi:branched-chain amino acid transport system substrate-binding protein
MKLKPSTVLLLGIVILLNMGVTAYITQTIITSSPQPPDYSPEIRELRNELRTLVGKFDVLVDFVESKHGIIWDLEQDETNQSEVLFQDREVVIGVIPASSQTYSYYVPYVEEIIEPALNQLSWDMGSDIFFSFEILDAQGQAAVHLETVQHMQSMGINLIIGGMWSSQACASLGYCNHNNILLFSPSSTSPLKAIRDDNLFRLCPTDFKAVPVITEMIKSKGIEAVVVIQRGDSWADGIYDNLVEELDDNGIVLAKRVRYAAEVTEFSNYLEAAEEVALEAVEEYGWEKVAVELVSFSEAVIIAQSIPDYPTLYNLTWFGSEGTVELPHMVEEALEEAAHVKLYSMEPVLLDTPGVLDLSHSYENVTGRPLDYYAACSYDIAMIIGKAVIEADTIDTVIVKAKIQEICEDYQGVTGLCSLDFADDRATANYGIYSYSEKDGEFGYWMVGLYSDSGELTWFED